MGIYQKLHESLMKNKPNVMQEYSKWLSTHENSTVKGRISSYIQLVELLHNDKNGVKIKKGELQDNSRISEEELLNKLMKYDVISFDLFDTLVFRNVDDKRKVYELLAAKTNDNIFTVNRIEAERTLNGLQPYYNIYSIYDVLRQRGQASSVGPQDELELELSICAPNPYMYFVYTELVKAGKTVVLLADSYWPKEDVKKILEKCGYDLGENIFISCDINKSKQVGNAYVLLASLFSDKRRIHIGSDINVDYKNARKNNIHAYYYESIYDKGNMYRIGKYYDITLGNAISNSIINQEIHNGICNLSLYEQYGFLYGGKLVTGYCHYINEQVCEKKIDKLLFLARDANIIHQVYNKFYCDCKNEYVYASRNAVLPIVFEKYTDLYIEKILRFRTRTIRKTVEQTLKETELFCLIDKLNEVEIKKETIFDEKCLEKLIPLIYCYKADIVDSFSEQRQAAKKYFLNIIGNARRIAFVDIGWHGTIMLCLKHFILQECELDVDILLMQIGTFRDYWNESEVRNNKILSYCFSSDFNCDLCSNFRSNQVKIGLFELLFSANHPSLLFYANNEAEGLVFDNNSCDNVAVELLQSGILLYVKKYYDIESELKMQLGINGVSAISPILQALNNRQYVYKLFKDFNYSVLPGTETKSTLKSYI